MSRNDANPRYPSTAAVSLSTINSEPRVRRPYLEAKLSIYNSTRVLVMPHGASDAVYQVQEKRVSKLNSQGVTSGEQVYCSVGNDITSGFRSFTLDIASSMFPFSSAVRMCIRSSEVSNPSKLVPDSSANTLAASRYPCTHSWQCAQDSAIRDRAYVGGKLVC